MKKNRKVKICLISSSGGHFEQLKMLRKLNEKYDLYIVSEKTEYTDGSKYVLPGGNKNKLIYAWHLFLNFFLSIIHICKEKPDSIISTGTIVAFPTIFWAKIIGKKIIYIETFARVYGSTKSAQFIYKHHLYDLFLYQWESQKSEFPNGIYGGGIY
jgi:beta-1,4-N-acetylglucosaminyltransferase